MYRARCLAFWRSPLPSFRAKLVLMALCLASFYVSDTPAQSAAGAGGKDAKTPDVQSQPAKTEPSAAAPSDIYRIGVGDQLQINVWHEHDLSLTVVVRPDGIITLPLLNDLYVVGQTPKELAATITEKLKPFVNEPQVTVSTVAIQSRKVFVVGQ